MECRGGARKVQGEQRGCRGGCRGSREAAEGIRELQGLCRRFGAQELGCRQDRAGGAAELGASRTEARPLVTKVPTAVHGDEGAGMHVPLLQRQAEPNVSALSQHSGCLQPCLASWQEAGGGTPGRGDLRALGHPRVRTGPGDKMGERDLPGVGVLRRRHPVPLWGSPASAFARLE